MSDEKKKELTRLASKDCSICKGLGYYRDLDDDNTGGHLPSRTFIRCFCTEHKKFPEPLGDDSGKPDLK